MIRYYYFLKTNDKSSFLSNLFKEDTLYKSEQLEQLKQSLENNKNEPISGSIQINTIGNKKIFLYPQKTFTNEENRTYINDGNRSTQKVRKQHF